LRHELENLLVEAGRDHVVVREHDEQILELVPMSIAAAFSSTR